jgi:tetratricopeptide (TPR) repeat protein
MKPFLRPAIATDDTLKSRYAKHAEELQALPEGQTERFMQLMALLGLEAFQLGLLEDARDYLKNALTITQQLQNPVVEFHLRLQLAVCLQYLEDLEGADENFQQALKLTTQDGLQHELGTALVAWGKLLAEQGKYTVAASCFQRALGFEETQAEPNAVNVDTAENAIALLEALGPVDEKGYAVTYTEISHIEVPEIGR